MRFSLNLPNPVATARIERADVDTNYREQWQTLSRKAEELHQRIFRAGAFQSVIDESRAILVSGDDAALAVASEAPRFRRAFLDLWSQDDALASATMTDDRVRRVAGTQHTLSAMALLALINLHLGRFYELDTLKLGLFDTVEDLLRSHLAQAPSHKRLPRALQAVKEMPDMLIARDAPRLVAEALLHDKLSLAWFFREQGLQGYRDTNYGRALVVEHFIARLEKAKPKEDHAFLDELHDEALLKIPAGDGRYFGHRLLEIMGRTSTRPADSWLETVLFIAGDPRLTHTPRWIEWWRDVSDDVRDNVGRWLSEKDLELFLAALEQFGETSNSPDFDRMFKDRKVFLQGLLELGLVRETHIVVGYAVRIELDQMIGHSLMSDVGQLLGSTGETGRQAIVVVHCGEFILVEGAQNFQLRIFVAPRVEGLLDRTNQGYRLDHFKTRVPNNFKSENGTGSGMYFEGKHQGSTWQVRALEFLQDRNIAIPLEKVMSRESLQTYARRHGLPYHLMGRN